MSSKKTIWWSIGSIILALIMGIAIGKILSGNTFLNKFFPTAENKINTVLDIIDQEYVDPVNMNDLSENAITNIVKELDPHSAYIAQKELEEMQEMMDGYFGGLGVTYFLKNDTIVILHILHGGPSSQAGLLPGDRIIYVNDSLFIGPDISEEKILATFRGKAGTPIRLGIQRPSSDTIIEYVITRGNVPISTIRSAYEIDKGIGFIKIYDRFSHTTYEEFIRVITKLTAQGCHSFIIDLRMNGGGALEAAIKIANEFLPAGQLIVYVEGKAFQRRESISDGNGNLPENQVVILIDQLSASASEVVAGALQDNDRALIVGRRSFGKGLVQNQIELADHSALKLTIARYYTPSGRNIQRQYEMGKSDEYNQDWINRLNNGEEFHLDSIKLDTTQLYKTAHGRTVYGGGGIMPDIFVPIDTTDLTSYYLKLEKHDIFNQYAFQYFDNNLHLKETYKDYESMWEYLKTQPLLNEIIDFANEKGVRKRTHLINRSADQILTTTYAHILNNFFGEEATYPILMKDDPIVQKAIEAIHNGEAIPQRIIERNKMGVED